jgi:hypothetical protein
MVGVTVGCSVDIEVVVGVASSDSGWLVTVGSDVLKGDLNVNGID